MNTMQPPALHPVLDRIPAHAQLQQLPERHHPVLVGSQSRHTNCNLTAHIAVKLQLVVSSPP
jgi:hypothetical protein